MKQLFTILFFALSMTASGQYTLDISDGGEVEHNTKTRVDTAYGMIVWVDYGKVSVDVGFVSNTVISYYTTVPCPDPSYEWGCAVLHYGWVDKVKSTTYHLAIIEDNLGYAYLSEIIDDKWIIKFIPNQ